MNRKTRKTVGYILCAVTIAFALPTVIGIIPSGLGIGIVFLLAAVVQEIYAYNAYEDGKKGDMILRFIIGIVMLLIGIMNFLGL